MKKLAFFYFYKIDKKGRIIFNFIKEYEGVIGLDIKNKLFWHDGELLFKFKDIIIAKFKVDRGLLNDFLKKKDDLINSKLRLIKKIINESDNNPFGLVVRKNHYDNNDGTYNVFYNDLPKSIQETLKKG